MMLRDRSSRPGETESGVTIVVPHLPHDAGAARTRAMLDSFLAGNGIRDFVAWYYTPMALEFSEHLRPAGHGLRLYGRAERVRWRADRHTGEGARASIAGRRRLDWRAQSLRGEAHAP